APAAGPEPLGLRAHARGAVRRGRVAREELLEPAGVASLLLLQQVEKARHRGGVVAGLLHRADAEQVRLVLVVAAELHEHRVQPEAADRLDDLARRPVAATADQAAQDAEPRLRAIGLRG